MIVIVLLMLVPAVFAQYEFQFKGGAEGTGFAPELMKFGGLTGYQIAFLIGYAIVVFGIVQQGLYKWGGFNPRLAAGVALGFTIMASVPMVDYVSTTGFMQTFKSLPTGLGSIGLIIVGLILFFGIYKYLYKVVG